LLHVSLADGDLHAHCPAVFMNLQRYGSVPDHLYTLFQRPDDPASPVLLTKNGPLAT